MFLSRVNKNDYILNYSSTPLLILFYFPVSSLFYFKHTTREHPKRFEAGIGADAGEAAQQVRRRVPEEGSRPARVVPVQVRRHLLRVELVMV